MVSKGAEGFSRTCESFDTCSAQAGYAPYNISRTLQAYDGLDSGISQKTCATAGLRRHVETFAPLPGILCPQKGLQGGYVVARKRDEESRALFVGSSRCGVETA